MKLTLLTTACLGLLCTAAYPQGALYPTPRNEQNPPEAQAQTTPEDPAPEQSAGIGPIVEVELSAPDVIVGQPIRLQIKVLVPTYMPQPPIYPTIELPDLMVRLPARATTPTSERRDGVSLSGTIRTYRLYPLAAGPFEIPEQVLNLTYANPETNAPTTTEIAMPAQSFTATVPAAAQDLDPPVIAAGFTLEQEVQGETSLGVGDAITRVVTARIEGTTPVLIPPLVAAIVAPALRAYPKEPRVTSTEERGVLSGSRNETVTYLVQSDGTAELPEITIEWYDTTTQAVQTATVEAVKLTLAPAPLPPPDYRKLALRAATALIALWAFWRLIRRLSPRILTAWEAARAIIRATEYAAARHVIRSIAAKDLNATYTTVTTWSAHATALNASDWSNLDNALLSIGSSTYSERSRGAQTDWRFLAQSFNKLRKTNRNKYLTLKNQRILPNLNTDRNIPIFRSSPTVEPVER
ncbi:BatD family protein [Tropicibacter sp. Alg240-R139]|uniref:BatD family protein n=1 Tax=Tropicibacter sp. Alg240-R139 TaxID=2305991 RepID=UPI0013E06356|nr:BatD family protein [Tropicibacter sp. Alg240-R139]